MRALVRRLRALPPDSEVPLLVVRLRGLERIAWREGRTAARAVERRSLRSFAATANRTLRSSDILAHDRDSSDFLAALRSPTRSSGAVPSASDFRSTLARLSSAMQRDGGMQVESGWTILRPAGSCARLGQAIEAALERGARERERYEFFSTIGHELRTPLTSINGYLETLLDQDLDPQTARRFLEVARAEASRMGRLVDGMFDVSLLDLRAGAFAGESSDLGAAVAAAICAVEPLALRRRTALGSACVGDAQIAIGGDRLTQIIVNLIENAIKHGREAGRVVVSLGRREARFVQLCVDDDGPGVPAEEWEAIFALGVRGRRTKARGSGIGLAVVKLMLERIGGEVSVGRSALGGSLFSLRLPLAEAAASAAPLQPALAVASA